MRTDISKLAESMSRLLRLNWNSSWREFKKSRVAEITASALHLVRHTSSKRRNRATISNQLHQVHLRAIVRPARTFRLLPVLVIAELEAVFAQDPNRELALLQLPELALMGLGSLIDRVDLGSGVLAE